VDQPLSQIKRLKFMHMRPHRLLLLPCPVSCPLSLAWRHCWPIWLINVGRSAHVGEEQLMAIKRIGILPVAAMFRASTP